MYRQTSNPHNCLETNNDHRGGGPPLDSLDPPSTKSRHPIDASPPSQAARPKQMKIVKYQPAHLLYIERRRADKKRLSMTYYYY